MRVENVFSLSMSQHVSAVFPTPLHLETLRNANSANLKGPWRLYAVASQLGWGVEAAAPQVGKQHSGRIPCSIGAIGGTPDTSSHECRESSWNRRNLDYIHILSYIHNIIIYYHILSYIIIYYHILSYIIIYSHILSYIIIYFIIVHDISWYICVSKSVWIGVHPGSAWNDGGAPRALHFRESDGLYDAWQRAVLRHRFPQDFSGLQLSKV